jgi:hypothetical protein
MDISTIKYHRYNTIYNWKQSGLIYHDFDELYQTYINTLECQHCLKVFTSTKDRCLDHCHTTGQFRKIVCHKCNIHDSYINYPNGYTEEIRKEKQKKKYDCECGGKYTHEHKSKHFKTKKHLLYL